MVPQKLGSYEFHGNLHGNSGVTFLSIWRSLWRETSAHGPPQFTFSGGLFKKTLWACILLGTFVAVGYNISLVFIHFFSYPIDVEVQIENKHELEFPAVTVCNMNPYRKSALIQNPTILDIISKYNSTVNLEQQTVYKVKRRKKRATDIVFGPLRLQDGNSSYDGRAEAFYEGVWGTICDKESSSKGWAGVFCRDLFGTYAEKAGQCVDLGYPIGTENISFYRPGCSLSDLNNTLANCIRLGRAGSCGHDEDGCIQCAPPTSTTPLPPTTTMASTTSSGSCSCNCCPGNTDSTTSLLTSTVSTESSSATHSTTSTSASSQSALTSSTTMTTQNGLTSPAYSLSSTTQISTTSAITSDSTTSSISATETTTDTPSNTTQVTSTTTEAVVQTTSNSLNTNTLFQNLNKLFSDNVKLLEEVKHAIAEMDVAEKSRLGYYKEDFIMACSFAGYPCYDMDFSGFYNHRFGNCFTFNSGWNKSYSIEKIHRPGQSHGLKLALNIDQSEYVGELASSAGVRVVIHHNGEMPFPEDDGFSVGTGKLTSAGISLMLMERLNGNHGTCWEDNFRDKTRNVYEEHYPVRYSKSACMRTCYQRELINKCNCADAAIPRTGKAFDYKNVSICDNNNAENALCQEELDQLNRKNSLNCDCPLLCRDNNYVPILSSCLWPPTKTKEDVLIQLESASANNRAKIEQMNPDMYESNLLKLNVYYSVLNYEIVTEKPAYETSQFISDIGGIAGLWIGCSMLSFFELIEFLMDTVVFMFYTFYYHGYKKKENKKSDSTSNLQ